MAPRECDLRQPRDTMTDTTPLDPRLAALARLRVPFEAHQIGKLPRATSKDGKKASCSICHGYHVMPAIHLDYVGHAATTDRLLDVDPDWYWEPMAFSSEGLPQFDKLGGLWIRLFILGRNRIGYGNADLKQYADAGAREKEVIGDSLRNAAMRFGVALDLWHKGDLHGPDATPPPDDGTGGVIDGHPDDVPTRQDAPKTNPRGDLPDYPKATFEANFATWGAAVAAGSSTPEAIIAKVSTVGRLNPTQRAKINSLKKAS